MSLCSSKCEIILVSQKFPFITDTRFNITCMSALCNKYNLICLHSFDVKLCTEFKIFVDLFLANVMIINRHGKKEKKINFRNRKCLLVKKKKKYCSLRSVILKKICLIY